MTSQGFKMLSSAILVLLLVFGQAVGILEIKAHPKIQLLADLTNNYNKILRPVYNDSTTINVTFGMALNQIINVLWQDEFLRWNASDYGGTSELTMADDMVWKPDIKLYNNIDEDFMHIDETSLLLSSDGTVYWLAPAVLKASCRIDLWKFPFDRQSCVFQFGSWAYNGNQLNMIPRSDSMDTSKFVDNGEWAIVETPSQRSVALYGCCPWPYVDIKMTLVIERMPLFYVFNLLLPNILIAGLTLLGFWLPPESGEKITLTITNLLSLIVFHQLVAQTMPPTGEGVPIIAQYFAAMIVMVVLSCVMTVWVLNIYHTERDTKSPPAWIQKIVFDIMAPMVCMTQEKNSHKRSRKNVDLSHEDNESRFCYTNGVALSEMSCMNVPPITIGMLENGVSVTTDGALKRQGSESQRSSDRRPTKVNDGTVTKLLEQVTFLTKRAKRKDSRKKIILEWQEMSKVIDRILMWIFVIYVVLLSTIMLLRAKGQLNF
ncbi:neuronal acetylcholine receptor subunit alpha-10-like [Glandiceps talaboti]